MSLLVLFGGAFAVQVVAWLALAVGFARAERHTSTPSGDAAAEPSGMAEVPVMAAMPIAVLVAARNEAARLPALLDALAAQTHPPAEVLIADDGSTDGTAAVAETYADRLPVRVVAIAEGDAGAAGLPRKKHALSRAIAAARHDRLAFTDADCVPAPDWLAAFARAATAEPDAVLVGTSPTRPAREVPDTPPSLASLVRFETMVTAFLTAAALGLGRPYMAVGRSISYPKSLFERLGGFAHQAASLSGDDDLLVQEVHRQRAAPIRFVADAVAPTDPPTTLGGWLRQKQRHTSAGRFYDRTALALLAGFHLTHGLVWLGAPVFWALGSWTGAGLLAALLLIQRGVLRGPAETLGTADVMPAWPFWMWGYALYNSFAAPLGGLGARRW
ncbi:MAG: glycosyltransferase [Bacteroidota bacterium]